MSQACPKCKDPDAVLHSVETVVTEYVIDIHDGKFDYDGGGDASEVFWDTAQPEEFGSYMDRKEARPDWADDDPRWKEPTVKCSCDHHFVPSEAVDPGGSSEDAEDGTDE